MTPEDFQFLAAEIKKRSGLTLSEDKSYLLETRLLPVARQHGFEDVSELTVKLRESRNEKVLQEVTEAMTTNESSFFRDKKPFDQLRDVVVPRLLENCGGKKSFRIWSAACSTGQEPYSVLMTLMEDDRLQGWNYEIVATDLSESVLQKAVKGVYSQFEVQRGLPIQLLMKYFDQDGEQWKIKPELPPKIRFQPLNLLEDFSSLGMFDVILCRNVLIYFDQETKQGVLERIAKRLNLGGVFYLGSTETTLGITDAFKPLDNERGLYITG